jgi:hypothetical protein
MMVSWFGNQNQVDYGLSVVPQNQWEDEGVTHVSRSSDLLQLKASRARVSQYDLKTGGSATQMVHMTSSWRLHSTEGEDGWVDVMSCVGPFYPNFIIFYVLGHRSILVF